MWQTYDYDLSTQRVTRMRLDRDTVVKQDAVASYTYNQSGEITAISTTSPQSGAATDTQCFKDDHRDRLIQAWTTTATTCPTSPAVGSGPAPYWYEWQYDASDNRTKEISHTAAGDTTTTWTHPAATATRPHGPTSVSVLAPGSASPTTTTLAYDTTGNVTNRTSGTVLAGSTAKATTFTYDTEGRVATSTAAGVTTSYAYDAAGNPLVRRDATTTTLYLPGGTELKLTRSSGALTAQRYMQFAGQTVAIRTGSTHDKVTYLTSDLNNTATWQINANTAAITTRRTTPFGGNRGSSTGYVGNRGFVDGTLEPTLGMIRIGARDYDPATGRFRQPDPLLPINDPTQWNAYAYGANSPINRPDPSGLSAPCGTRCGNGTMPPGSGPAPSNPTPVTSNNDKGTSSQSSGDSRNDRNTTKPQRSKEYSKDKHSSTGGYRAAKANEKPVRPAMGPPPPSLFPANPFVAGIFPLRGGVDTSELHFFPCGKICNTVISIVGGVVVGVAVAAACGLTPLGWVACGVIARAAGAALSYGIECTYDDNCNAKDATVAVTIGAALGPIGGGGGGTAVKTVGKTALSRMGNAAVAAGDHVVLGKSLGIEARAAAIGGRHLMGEDDWVRAVANAIDDPTTKVSVALDDVVDDGVYDQVMSAVTLNAKGLGSPFDREMAMLYQADALASVDFYQGGVLLANPWR